MTIIYKSATDFDRSLVLDIIESAHDRKTVFYYTGFATEAQAVEFADWWVDRQGWGYSPHADAYVDPVSSEITVRATRAASCD